MSLNNLNGMKMQLWLRPVCIIFIEKRFVMLRYILFLGFDFYRTKLLRSVVYAISVMLLYSSLRHTRVNGPSWRVTGFHYPSTRVTGRAFPLAELNEWMNEWMMFLLTCDKKLTKSQLSPTHASTKRKKKIRVDWVVNSGSGNRALVYSLPVLSIISLCIFPADWLIIESLTVTQTHRHDDFDKWDHHRSWVYNQVMILKWLEPAEKSARPWSDLEEGCL